MQPIDFPRHRLANLHELGARLLDSRRPGSDDSALARDLLGGFHDVCTRAGLDRVLAELEQAFPPLDIADRSSLAEHPTLQAALVAKLGTDFDSQDGGPRNAKPRLLAECIVAVLSLALTDEPDRTATLADEVRAELTAALASVIDVELAAPHLRAAIIASARALCEPRHHGAFDKIAAQLDDRGLTMIRQPKVALDAVQAVQHALGAARNAIVASAASAAIDRAKPVLARADADAAARIDQPITHRLTTRDVAIRRACDARIPKLPAAVAHSLFESLTELLHLAWRPVERPVRTYAASQAFAVGDLVEHPKFGRGSVISTTVNRIEVEFADGKHTLVHVGVK